MTHVEGVREVGHRVIVVLVHQLGLADVRRVLVLLRILQHAVRQLCNRWPAKFTISQMDIHGIGACATGQA